ncbi:hypothetical protein CR152_27750 [Massilia violaceinigra]|uniref:Uncharacterized protein n=2 Tax=Massilia violaceinigra TaxID=2045208 RepID=A0A2D2DSB5_9BURK|nr:hypothetical protein CR152_27750 [Massilia violaceinigra]
MKKGIVFKSGSWSVHQELDAMTDKKKCAALYEGAWTVQASDKDFFVSLRGRGGVRGYTVRIDDEPALPLRLADEMERDLSAVRLGRIFDQVYGAKRIRMQISTILNTVVAQDIDLKGFAESVDYMRQNCKD